MLSEVKICEIRNLCDVWNNWNCIQLNPKPLNIVNVIKIFMKAAPKVNSRIQILKIEYLNMASSNILKEESLLNYSQQFVSLKFFKAILRW